MSFSKCLNPKTFLKCKTMWQSCNPEHDTGSSLSKYGKNRLEQSFALSLAKPCIICMYRVFLLGVTCTYLKCLCKLYVYTYLVSVCVVESNLVLAQQKGGRHIEENYGA
jgi:hypothetical protein